MSEYYAAKVARVIAHSDDSQTRGIAQALEAQRHGHVFISETPRGAWEALSAHIDSIRSLQMVTGGWTVKIAMAETTKGRLGEYFIGASIAPDLHFPAQEDGAE